MNNEWAVIEKLEYTAGGDVKTLTVTVKTNSKSLPLQQVISGDMGSTRALFDKLKEIAKEPVRDVLSVHTISDEDMKVIRDMLNRTPPIPICHGDIWPDDEEEDTEEGLMEEEIKEHEKYMSGMSFGMDYSIRCIVQEMMECFNPNTAMVSILTSIEGLYNVYARKNKIPERVRNEVMYGLEHIVETIRMNNRDQKEEEE